MNLSQTILQTQRGEAKQKTGEPSCGSPVK
jgi:hypothetical protein